MKENIYWPLSKLESQGLIKFKINTPKDILRDLREVEIFIDSYERLNMMIKEPPNSYVKNGNNKNNKEQVPITCPLTFIFSYVEQINLEEIKFFNKKSCEDNENEPLLPIEKSLIYTMSKINLPKLEELDLKNCQIESLESLSFLDLKNLKKLFLGNNNLVSLSVFARLYMPKLYWLELNNNEIKDTKGFNRILMAKRIALIEVSEKDINAAKDAFTYLSNWIFKLPFDHINYIRKNEKYLDFNLISQKKALQRYPYLSFR